MLNNVAREKDRPFDVAYEQVSGDGMVAYWDDTSGEFAYRIWNGATLSAQVLMSGSATNHSHYLALVPKPGTNEILCLCNDHNFDTGLKRILAKVWNGSSWSAWTEISQLEPKFDRECFSGAWESLSGRAMVVYGEAGQAQPRYRTWNGSVWSAASTLPTIGEPALWVRIKANPNSNQILFAAQDDGDDLESNVWSGSAWGANQQFCTDVDTDPSRRFDLAFEPGTGRALLVNRNKNYNYPVYRTWNGASWSAEQNGTNINRKSLYVQLVPGFRTGEIFLATSDDTYDLHLMNWNGSVLGADTVMETSLPTQGQEPACIVGAPTTPRHPKLLSWTETQP